MSANGRLAICSTSASASAPAWPWRWETRVWRWGTESAVTPAPMPIANSSIATDTSTIVKPRCSRIADRHAAVDLQRLGRAGLPRDRRVALALARQLRDELDRDV